MEPYLPTDERIKLLMDQVFSFNTRIYKKKSTIRQGNDLLATTLQITKSLLERETRSTIFQIKHSLADTQRRKRELSIRKLIETAMHDWFEMATNDDIGKISGNRRKNQSKNSTNSKIS